MRGERLLRVGVAAVLGVSASWSLAQDAPPPSDPVVDAAPPPPSLVLRGFGNVDYEVEGNDGGNQFVLGELDLFLTSQLTDSLSVLAEVALEPEEGHEVIVDLERFQIKWSPSDLVNVAAGRMHSWIGYWNHTYHHGTWLQVTAFRPLVYRFENDGGVLPLHEVGIQTMGTWARPSFSFLYNVSLTNGRSPTARDIQSVSDANDGKAVNLWAGVQPTAIPGLLFGGSLRFDRIPEDLENPDRAGEMDEDIQAAFAVYDRGGAQVFAEYVRVEHEEGSTGRRFVSSGFYLQGSMRLGRLRPYYRYDDLDRDPEDPFLADAEPSQRKHTLGLRLDPWPWAGLMVEASHHDPLPGETFNSATIQLAFTF
jgi:hypothetical protein